MPRNSEFDGYYGPVLHFKLQDALTRGGSANLAARQWLKDNPGITTMYRGSILDAYPAYRSKPTIRSQPSAQPTTEKPVDAQPPSVINPEAFVPKQTKPAERRTLRLFSEWRKESTPPSFPTIVPQKQTERVISEQDIIICVRKTLHKASPPKQIRLLSFRSK